MNQISVETPVTPVLVAIPPSILLMAQRIAADKYEHGTRDPIFVVEKRRIVAGFDLDYCERTAWFYDSQMVTGEEAKALEAEYQLSDTVPTDYVRTGIVEEWQYYAAYITEEAANEFVASKGEDFRVNVDSAYRNHEWKALRAFLLSLAGAATPA